MDEEQTSHLGTIARRLATVVIGGLITATVLTLYILPLLYPWFSRDADKSETIDAAYQAV